MNALAELLVKSRRTVFFGGAGVSTESGIPDFRSADGLYRQGGSGLRRVPPEEILSATFFYAHTEEFYDFYRSKMIYPDAKPGKAHQALAALERMGRLSLVATQNIDGLHQDAGSRNVAELHGTVRRNRCLSCGREYGLDIITDTVGVPHCPCCGGLIKPLVTLYEEALPEGVFERAALETQKADLMIVGGTSLAVYPAAGLVRYFGGRQLVVINYSPTSADAYADLVFHRSIGEVLSEAVTELQNEGA